MMDDYELRTFDGDTEALASLIDISWRHDLPKSKVMFSYDRDWLDWTLNSPRVDRELLVSLYHHGDFVGFFCALPVHMMYRGSKAKAAVTTLLTVHPDHRGKKLAWKLAYGLRDRRDVSEYDFYYGFLYAGRTSYKMAQKYMSSGGEMIEMITGPAAVRPLIPEDIKRANRTSWYEDLLIHFKSGLKPGRGRIAEKGDIDAAVELLNSHSKRLELARLWDRKELKWYMDSKLTSVIVHESGGDIDGIMMYSTVNMITQHGEMKVAEMEGATLPSDRKGALELILHTLNDARNRGCGIMSYIDFGYLNWPYLRRAGFIRYGRKLSMYAEALGKMKLEPVKKAYVELK